VIAVAVKLYHPELDVTIERPESSVPVHMASGWKPVDEQPQAAATEPTAAEAEAAANTEPERKSEKSAARTRRSSTNASEESTDGGA
jgi:hypothetical protein